MPTEPPIVESHNDKSANCSAVNAVKVLAPYLTLLILVKVLVLPRVVLVFGEFSPEGES